MTVFESLKSKKESQESDWAYGLTDLFLHTRALIPKAGELIAWVVALLPLGWMAAEGGEWSGERKTNLESWKEHTVLTTQFLFNDAKNTTYQKFTLILEGNHS